MFIHVRTSDHDHVSSNQPLTPISTSISTILHNKVVYSYESFYSDKVYQKVSSCIIDIDNVKIGTEDELVQLNPR